MKRLLKYILKIFIPQHLRSKIRYILNLQCQIESLNENIHNIQQRFNDIQWELQKIKNIFLLKENSPLLFNKIKIPLIDDTLFADLAGKQLLFPEIIDLKNDFLSNARKLVIRFAINSNNAGVPLDTIQNILLELFKIEAVSEHAFFYLVERLFFQYEDDNKARILENAFLSLKVNKFTDHWYISNAILRWICFLMLRGENEKAKNIFLEKKNIFKNEEIASWMPVSYLAYENNIKSNEIYISSEVFKRFRDQKNIINEFENYLKDKSVAIVGNGPYEIGTAHGEEIDNHDIVIRFNRFIINDNFKKDYGSKLNVISNDGFCEITHHYFEADYIIFPGSMYFSNFSIKVINFIFENPKIKMINHNTDIRKIFQDKFNNHRQTTGIKMVYYLNNVLNIKKLNIYGFSINKVESTQYFNTSTNIDNDIIDLDHEHEIYKIILKKGNI